MDAPTTGISNDSIIGPSIRGSRVAEVTGSFGTAFDQPPPTDEMHDSGCKIEVREVTLSKSRRSRVRSLGLIKRRGQGGVCLGVVEFLVDNDADRGCAIVEGNEPGPARLV